MVSKNQSVYCTAVQPLKKISSIKQNLLKKMYILNFENVNCLKNQIKIVQFPLCETSFKKKLCITTCQKIGKGT